MLLLGDVEQGVLVDGHCRPLALQFENHDTVIVTCSKKVDLWVCSNDPEAVVFALEALYAGSLVQVPNPDGFILTDRQNKILVRVEETA